MPEWAKPLQAEFTHLARDNADVLLLQDKAAVVLRNDGWVHEKAMKR